MLKFKQVSGTSQKNFRDCKNNGGLQVSANEPAELVERLYQILLNFDRLKACLEKIEVNIAELNKPLDFASVQFLT